MSFPGKQNAFQSVRTSCTVDRPHSNEQRILAMIRLSVVRTLACEVYDMNGGCLERNLLVGVITLAVYELHGSKSRL